jgi:hypothetical protein
MEGIDSSVKRLRPEELLTAKLLLFGGIVARAESYTFRTGPAEALRSAEARQAPVGKRGLVKRRTND